MFFLCVFFLVGGGGEGGGFRVLELMTKTTSNLPTMHPAPRNPRDQSCGRFRLFRDQAPGATEECQAACQTVGVEASQPPTVLSKTHKAHETTDPTVLLDLVNRNYTSEIVYSATLLPKGLLPKILTPQTLHPEQDQ